MTDEEVISRIDELVKEEKELLARAVGKGLNDEERARLRDIQAHLDQCWDFLRQRRAREEFGEDPDTVQPRPIPQVESYRQ